MEDGLWERICNTLQRETTATDFNQFITPLRPEIDGAVLKLTVHNRFALEKVQERFLERIDELARNYGDPSRPVEVVLKLVNRDAGIALPKRAATHFSDAIKSEYTFERFVEGTSNKFAKEAAWAVAENPGQRFNPLLVYGGSGLGKTHLMHGIGNEIRHRHPGFNIIYKTAQHFVDEMVRALGESTMRQFSDKYVNAQVFLVDDIQFFAAKERSQEEFFNVFNTLVDSGAQVVLSCDRYPTEIEKLETRLASRCVMGLSAGVNLPDVEDRAAILGRKAAEHGIVLDSDIALYVAGRVRSNVRELEGALERVLWAQKIRGCPIDIALVNQTLHDVFRVHTRKITVEGIQKEVAEYFQIRATDLKDPTRKRAIARPRQIAMAIAAELTNNSLQSIGHEFGGRDHTTVLHAVRNVEKLRNEEVQVQEDYTHLLRMLSG